MRLLHKIEGSYFIGLCFGTAFSLRIGLKQPLYITIGKHFNKFFALPRVPILSKTEISKLCIHWMFFYFAIDKY